ncbi:hypothetical protein ACQEVB_16320 [Pseudonocardia sp. CA-107938]|uniref:hypothetical protein n=1 Tax=Pseudonocardia sp. CA-107938 TaxID=3240021 RepID=UPI003D8A5B2E
MRRDAREWSIPDPLRALLWWPPVSLAIGIVAPDAAVVAIIVAGFVLALAGVLVHTVGTRLRRRPAPQVTQASEPAELDAAA